MDRDTFKRLYSSVKGLDLSEEDEEAVVSVFRRLRREDKPSAVVGVTPDADTEMGSQVRLVLGEGYQTVELPLPEDLRPEDAEETDYNSFTVDLSLNRVEEGSGEGRWTAVDLVPDPNARAEVTNPGKLLLEQNSATGEYRYRDLPEVDP